MRAPALGEAISHLPWLSPCAASLVALARSGVTEAWSAIRGDPGAVLLVLRCAPAARSAREPLFPGILRDPKVLEGALRLLDGSPVATVDWSQSAIHPILEASLTYAELANRLAGLTGRSDPETAWAAGLLAPLGWLAACAVDPEQAAACLKDPHLGQDPSTVERRFWGLDQPALARRLARRWGLPGWLTATTGYLAMPLDTALAVGADADLFRLIQLAVGLAEAQRKGLALRVGARPVEAAAALGLSAGELDLLRADLQAIRLPACKPAAAQPTTRWTSPAEEPLVRDLLVLALESRSQSGQLLLDRLEGEVDSLHDALDQQRSTEVNRLQAQKLGTLAEFAAGASHDINNPLAVISGQAQYMLADEKEASRQRALQTIIGQTQRIHDILNELMLFARPPRPQKRTVEIGSLVREVALSLSDLASQKQVRLVCPEMDSPISLHADPRHVCISLTCLLRNAIEAAPAEGWAGVRVLVPADDRLEVLVEDSGPGPTSHQREHMFDPFYSGRPAGRGRGLGLPTAWRLAREQGGDVYYDELAANPTRFVLCLPRDAVHTGSDLAGEPAPLAPFEPLPQRKNSA